MRTILFFLVAVFLSFSLTAQDFTVNKLDVEVTIHKEGYFDITEKYDITFHEPKHGIFRIFTTKYDVEKEDGSIEKRDIQIDKIQIPGHQFTRSPKMGDKFLGEAIVQIGDPKKLITGKQHYEIKYRVENALIFSDSLVEFYWNIKPGGWETDFKNITFAVHTPEGMELSSENSFVYSDSFGEEENPDHFEYTFLRNRYSGTSKEGFISKEGEHVTLLIKMPTAVFTSKIFGINNLKKWSWLGIIGGLYLIFWIFWIRYGKDTRVVAITSYYPPENIDPALAGFLMKDEYDKNQLISFIPQWGAEGFIKLEDLSEEGKSGIDDLKIIRLKELPDNRPHYETIMFHGLFNHFDGLNFNKIFRNLGTTMAQKVAQAIPGGEASISYSTDFFTVDDKGQVNKTDGNSVKLSDLQNTFYTSMHKAENELNETATKYYEVSGEKATLLSILISSVLTFVVPSVMLYTYGILAAAVSFITCLILVVLSFTMKKKNVRGSKMYAELLGFYRFIKVADEARIKMLLEQDPYYFEKTMSYALSFGMLDSWASKFNSLGVSPPNWYGRSRFSVTHTPLRFHNFTQKFSGNMAMASLAMVSSPVRSSGYKGSGSSSSGRRSSGGGRSGGGFGRGGGRSW